jgi:polar amino acid transport system permease protein
VRGAAVLRVKRSTRRRLTQGALYVILLGGLAALVFAADWAAVRENYFDVHVLRQLWPEIITVGVRNVVVFTAIAFAGGLILGLLLALMKLSPVAPYRWMATSYIEFFRGLPALLVILGVGFTVPIAFHWQPPGGTVGAGLFALILVSAAYIAETLRAGIQAVPKGQVEASRSLGMSSPWTTFSVVLPQAFRIVIPPLTNEFVLLIKDTSLLFVIGVAMNQRELTTFTRDAASSYGNSSSYTAAAVAYLVITLPLTRLVAWLERRQGRAR